MVNIENTEEITKREYVLSTDSSADMDYEYYKENNVPVIGLHYIIGDDEYIQYDKNALDIKTFYDKVRKGAMPKTSQVAYEDIYNLFEGFVKEGKDIFHLAFSGALSGTYQTCVMAANDIMEKYPEATVKVIDSVSASGGQGLLLHYLVKRRDQGAELDELVEYAEVFKYNLIHVFTVDDLNHLHRGGRVSKVSAVVGSVLGIKPVLHVNDKGELKNYAKARGRKQSLIAMAKQMKAVYTPGENDEIFINDGDSREDAEFLAKTIKEMMPDVKTVRHGHVGAVIGSHTGAGVIALFFVGKNREPVEIK